MNSDCIPTISSFEQADKQIVLKFGNYVPLWPWN